MSDEEHQDREPEVVRDGMTRREAVKLMSLAPLIGVLEWSRVDVDRATRFADGLTRTGARHIPRFFTADEWRTLNVLVDYIIPGDERSGSATEARVPEFMDFMYSDEETAMSDAARTGMRDGLGWLDEESRRRFRATFADASDAQRRQLLDDIAWPRLARPEMADGVTFFNRVRDMTAAGFFSSAMGWQDLDYRGHTFVREWDGCPEPALRKLGVSYDLMNTRIPVQNGQD
jgi:gluconate 2-dehydrogenase gamma chain